MFCYVDNLINEGRRIKRTEKKIGGI